MKTIAIVIGLLILVVDGAALAQGAGSSGGAGSKGAPSSQAPVGHRQVRPADLPKAEQAEDTSTSGTSKEDRELDRKIKGICRGC
jgi:hypothetical protein